MAIVMLAIVVIAALLALLALHEANLDADYTLIRIAAETSTGNMCGITKSSSV